MGADQGSSSSQHKLQPLRGTRDLLFENKVKLDFIQSTAMKMAPLFGYEPIETPVMEFDDVFHRTLGDTSDIVSKETYTFVDRGGDKVTLRPEGTAGVARAFISEGLAQNLPLRLIYSGPMFRYERPQKGRYRQFYQVGVECLGLENYAADVECISFAYQFLQALGLKDSFVVELNTLGDVESRTNYRQALVQYFSQHKERLSPESLHRLEKNPLRILDSKAESDKALFAGAPSLQDHLNESSRTYFANVQAGLEALGIPFKLNERLVRGLDYYCHTVFEFTTTALGAQGALLAGGRYDGLIELMGGPRTPGVGWGSGVDRLMEMIPEGLIPKTQLTVALIGADDKGEMGCMKLAHDLRKQSISCQHIMGGNIGKKMKKADKLGAKFALIVGERELNEGQLSVKNLATGHQESISTSSLAAYLVSQG